MLFFILFIDFVNKFLSQSMPNYFALFLLDSFSRIALNLFFFPQ